MEKNQKNPLVSVIIPVYGVEKYIEKCARSVFEQTYQNLEIIFVDDCSPDKSVQILKKILEEYSQVEDKIQILSYNENRGLAGARKFGLEHAHGKYVLQIDSDDYIETTMVEVMVAIAEKEMSEIVICDYKYIKFDKIDFRHISPSQDPQICMKQVLEGSVPGFVANKLILLDLYVKNGITPTIGLNMREDISVMYKLMFYSKRISHVSECLYNYIYRNDSYSHQLTNISNQMNALQLVQQMESFFKEYNVDATIQTSFRFFKAAIKSEMLLFGDIKKIDESLFTVLSFKSYINHPNLIFLQKFVGILNLLKLNYFVFMIRYVVRQLLKLRKRIR